MLKLLASSMFGSRFIQQLRPLRVKLRQRSSLFGRLDEAIIRFVAARLESGFSESLLESGRVRSAQLNLVNWRLWSGHSRYALDVIQRIFSSDVCDNSIRADSAMYLAAWYAAAGDSERSLEMQVAAAKLAPEVAKSNTYILLKMDNLLDCGSQGSLERYLAEIPPEAKSDRHVRWSLLNAVNGGKTTYSERWLASVNAHFRSEGLCEVEKKRDDLPLDISNLKVSEGTGCAAERYVSQRQPLVSIIVPAYNAESRIAVALESLIEQTWSNFEVLVVDDCSTDRTKDIVRVYADQDSRIRYLSMPENKGSYSARNHGLDYAKGELVTTHDIDDWSHPDKLLEQASELIESPSLVANFSMAARCTESLRILGNWRPNGVVLKENFSSFMFRKSILERVGKWDSVRIGGDSEFVNRVKLFFGNNSVSVVKPDSPLSFILGDHDSLTSVGATHIRTFYFGVRREYAAMSALWHKMLRKDDAVESKPYASVPSMIRPDRSRHATVKTAILLDAANDHDGIKLVHDLVGTAVVDGEVGIFHWPEFGKPREPDIAPGLRHLAFNGHLAVLMPGQVVFADKVIIASMGIWHSVPDAYPEITVSAKDAVNDSGGFTCTPEAIGLPEGMITVQKAPVSECEGKRL